MSNWRITGGNSLNGEIRVQGSKNAVLPIMAASIITGCETELINCPMLSDVEAAIEILRHLGCIVDRDADTIYIDSRPMTGTDIPHYLMREMRSSVIFLGAILARAHSAQISYPGGCELGARPVDLHLEALRTLGAQITEQGGELFCRDSGLRGGRINLAFPSVGATENVMLSACAAEGETVITNAAREPEIIDLQDYLIKLGARVSGAGTSTVVIGGFEPRKRVGHRVMTDRIVAATLLCSTACAGGNVSLKSVTPEHFETVTSALEQMGCEITRSSMGVSIRAGGALRAARPISTGPYPAFPTDAQPLLMAACLKAVGTTVFTENIFENRFRHAIEMRRLGADIDVVGRVAIIKGVERLSAARVTATDLRGGAALVAAALAAEGRTELFDSGHINRGYERLDRILNELGAEVELIEN
ncbi:MAG: UDP-N-acetylglucosamine 1-carboxyvinyltransferase [Oscillospiraceae bacterium]|jgi:UDP-N-acetylglucosamine 1-carboxyvinyltransferase|nr:UDP-N-acetylglucosamine 1-carboxyvinyltransferase [Oscillospiraceae bacterium]